MDYKLIQNKLLNWFEAFSRSLPWRETRDPYAIWVSEVILQQTQVKQGLAYFYNFMDKFPTVAALAEAEEDSVLQVWQGLGYYSRARNMQKAAQMIMQDFKGVFPTTYEDLLTLKGVGPYTASAIASFAYDLPYPCVDGNVYRVLSRLFAEEAYIDTSSGKKIFNVLAQTLYNKEKPGLHNQAMMEFGALQCTPVNPDCESCPLQFSCLAYAQGSVLELPRKQGKIIKKDRFLNYLLIQKEDKTYVEKRIGKGIWEGLYQLPLIETQTQLSEVDLLNHLEFQKMIGNTFISLHKGPIVKHVLSHQNLFAQLFTLEVTSSFYLEKPYQEVERTQLKALPFPVLIQKKLLKIL